jgi:hypothetical protein
MDEKTFWTLIDTSREISGNYLEKQVEWLIETLSRLPESEIMEFERLLFEMKFRAYRADLWEAADIIACGCSDSGFQSFREWLIAQGEIIFKQALENPETLAHVVDKAHRETVIDGRLVIAPWRAYELKTNRKMPLAVYRQPELIGEIGKEEERQARFPQLVSKLGICDE